MDVIEVATPAAFAAAAADWLGEQLRAAPAAVLALPTGNTPLPLYAELGARARRGALRVERARVFNLDEYCGVARSDPHSFAHYMQRHVIAPLALRPEQVRLLQGDAPDLALECRAYDAALAQAGGIDACVLGLGANGHIAFNEPGTPWGLRTHVSALSESTRAAQPGASHAPGRGWKVPERGITMGIATLLEARCILLLIAGSGKAAAADALFRRVPDIQWPVTSLAAHPRLTVLRLREGAERR